MTIMILMSRSDVVDCGFCKWCNWLWMFGMCFLF